MAEPLTEIIAHALMPSVMISAGAVILQGVWTEHRALSDRIRATSKALRDPELAEDRHVNKARQLALLRRRLRLSVSALTSIYAALGSFLFITLAIAAGGTRMPQTALRLLFVFGVLLMFVAVTLVLWDVRLANRSLDTELEDHESILAHH